MFGNLVYAMSWIGSVSPKPHVGPLSPAGDAILGGSRFRERVFDA
jgi:hypothetical protein